MSAPKWRIPIAEPLFDDSETTAVVDVMESGRITAGERVAEFEERIAKYLGRKYAIACSSGTCANEIAIMALLQPNMQDLISSGRLIRGAVPCCTSVAVSNPLLYARVTPNFLEIDSKLCIDASKLEDHQKNNFILAVHAYGQHSEKLDDLLDFCRTWHVPLIEDTCVALGSEHRGEKLGSFGVTSTLSFYANKLLVAGEAGMVLTDEEQIADYCRRYSNHGRKKSIYHEEWFYTQLGRNAKLTDLEAAIGLAQFKKIDRFIDARKKIAERLYDVVKGDSRFLSYRPSTDEVPWCFWIANLDGTLNLRETSRRLQTDYGIETRPTLPVLPHLPIYNMKDMRFPMGEASQNGFMVSCSPAMYERGDHEFLGNSLKEVLG